MKFNLEKLKEAARADEECFDNSNIWAALEGFEADLRKKKEKSDIEKQNFENSQYIIGYHYGRSETIKEILGE